MSIGVVLVAMAVILIVVAYLARPFRVASAGADLDRAIDAWVAQVRVERKEERGSEEAGERLAYCPQCGRRVGLDDRFCAGCGIPLREAER